MDVPWLDKITNLQNFGNLCNSPIVFYCFSAERHLKSRLNQNGHTWNPQLHTHSFMARGTPYGQQSLIFSMFGHVKKEIRRTKIEEKKNWVLYLLFLFGYFSLDYFFPSNLSWSKPSFNVFMHRCIVLIRNIKLS